MRVGGLLPLGNFPIPDVLFCTSLLDVAAARVQVEGKIGKRLPTVLYMHENQVEYPANPSRHRDERDVHFALTNLISIFSADLVLWNSRWNLESFLNGILKVVEPCRGIPFDDLEARVRVEAMLPGARLKFPNLNPLAN